jgi:hypothetical protein
MPRSSGGAAPIFEGFSAARRAFDKTSFMLSEGQRRRHAVYRRAEGVRTINLNAPSPYRNVLLAGTLNHQRGDNTTISLTVSTRPDDEEPGGGVTLPSAGTNWRFTEESCTYTQQTIIRPTLLNQFRLFVGQEFEPTTSVSADPKVVVLDAFTGGGAQADSLRTEHHFTLTDMLTWSRGRNVLKAGINIPDWSRRRFDDNTNFGGTFYFSPACRLYGRAAVLADPAGGQRPRRLPPKGWLACSLRDEVRLGPCVVRVIRAPDSTGRTIFTTPIISVRARSVAFAPTEDGHTVIRVGAGAFYDRSGPRPIRTFCGTTAYAAEVRHHRSRVPEYLCVRTAIERPASEHRPAVAEHRHPWMLQRVQAWSTSWARPLAPA